MVIFIFFLLQIKSFYFEFHHASSWSWKFQISYTSYYDWTWSRFTSSTLNFTYSCKDFWEACVFDFTLHVDYIFLSLWIGCACAIVFYHQCSSQATFSCSWGWTFYMLSCGSNYMKEKKIYFGVNATSESLSFNLFRIIARW